MYLNPGQGLLELPLHQGGQLRLHGLHCLLHLPQCPLQLRCPLNLHPAARVRPFKASLRLDAALASSGRSGNLDHHCTKSSMPGLITKGLLLFSNLDASSGQP